jgi:hypothetical protein
MIKHPVSTYINWSAYDEGADTVELTEQIAMKQLDEMLRLRRLGVRFDYYIMDDFWYDRDGGYRTWRKPHWPNGPDRWINRCLENGVKPGLWIAPALSEAKLRPIPEWQDSVDTENSHLCFFHGGFLAHFMETLDFWYCRGIRIYKFDFFDFNAAPAYLREMMLPSEIRTANVTAFRVALKQFRQTHPEVVTLCYNGFEEMDRISQTDFSQRKIMDHRWLEVFDSIYCGDPRPADLPAMNFWRSKDIYSDHMVCYYQLNGLPLERIDNAGFMVGTTATCYHRGTACWKGMLLLSLARGGWMNTYYGNLDLIDDSMARWFARAQQMFFPWQDTGCIERFGGVPGRGEAYGYTALNNHGGLVTVVNPSQSILRIDLPASDKKRILFHDAGKTPVLIHQQIELGPEQMALVGLGDWAKPEFDLGIEEGVVVPEKIGPVDAKFIDDGKNAITASVKAPERGHLRIIFRQIDENGLAKRSSGGWPTTGTDLSHVLRIEARQSGKEIPVKINYDKKIWSGLSWAVGEIDARGLDKNVPVEIRCSTTEPPKMTLFGPIPMTLRGEIHQVEY